MLRIERTALFSHAFPHDIALYGEGREQATHDTASQASPSKAMRLDTPAAFPGSMPDSTKPLDDVARNLMSTVSVSEKSNIKLGSSIAGITSGWWRKW